MLETGYKWNKTIQHNLISLTEFNLPLIGSFTWLMPPEPYWVTTCRGRKLIFESHTYIFDHTRTWRAPDEGSAQCRSHLRDRTNMKDDTHQAHTVIPTRRIWNDDDGGQMIFRDLMGLKFPDICLTGEEKPPKKNLTQETCPNQGSNPGPLHDRGGHWPT